MGQDTPLQNHLRKCWRAGRSGIEHNTRARVHAGENERAVIAEFDLTDSKAVFRRMRDHQDPSSSQRLATQKIGRVRRFLRLFLLMHWTAFALLENKRLRYSGQQAMV